VFAARHEAGPGSETERWCVEDFTAAAAEVGAELGVSRFRAEADVPRPDPGPTATSATA
jgi:hypothetical protein